VTDKSKATPKHVV